jgi:dinuclear metal center YbgI/SA1388 family protein
MPTLESLVEYLETYLRHAEITDYPAAANGLQLENSGRVVRLGAAVDACEPVIAEAARRRVSLLLVHHGLMWDAHIPAFTGARYRKLKTAMSADLAIFSSHLPLDAHPTVGNAAQLAKAIGLRKVEPFFPYKGEPIGMRGELVLTREALTRKIEKAVGPAHLCAAGPSRVRRIGVVTGAAGSEIAAVAREGIDTFITGEGPHWSYTAAEEIGVNIFYAGHYATETFGVKALAARLSKKFRVPWQFIDHPSGL